MAPVNFLIPVKMLTTSKQRLASVLSLSGRISLVKRLLNNNIKTLRRHFPAHNILIVTPDPEIVAIARCYKADVLFEDQSQGLNHAVEVGTQWSLDHGYNVQVVIAPDIAHLSIEELKQLFVEADSRRNVVICAAKDKGTNVIFTSPPNIIPFGYGDMSSEVMYADAKKRGVSCSLLQLPHIAFDIDTQEDLLKAYPEYIRSFPVSADTANLLSAAL